MIKGSCNCKGVTFTVEPLEGTSACHCGQCRKQSGHHWASGEGKVMDFNITGEVRWYAESAIARRGFCPTCGSALFWEHEDDPFICFSTGSIDGPTGLTLRGHIHTKTKGDYYAINPNDPQRED